MILELAYITLGEPVVANSEYAVGWLIITIPEPPEPPKLGVPVDAAPPPPLPELIVALLPFRTVGLPEPPALGSPPGLDVGPPNPPPPAAYTLVVPEIEDDVPAPPIPPKLDAPAVPTHPEPPPPPAAPAPSCAQLFPPGYPCCVGEGKPYPEPPDAPWPDPPAPAPPPEPPLLPGNPGGP